MSYGEAASGDRSGRGDVSGDGAPDAGHDATPVVVTWDDWQRQPATFVWRRRRYRIERVLDTWVVETGWWKEHGRVRRSCWRVRAGGRVFDLRYDHTTRTWALERALS
jgi:hypothetical protein